MCDRSGQSLAKRARLSSSGCDAMEGGGQTSLRSVSCSGKAPDVDVTTEVLQSPNDRRKYRVIFLDNGLRALLISDLTAEEAALRLKNKHLESDGEDSAGEESATDDESEAEHSENDVTDDDDDEEGEEHGKKHGKKKECEKPAAAALCVAAGSFSDPADIPGLAHFLEHMVFMGSEKYPEENSFDSFMNKHGGYDNAYTDCERTVFYFEVNRKNFHEALDRFAQFFVAPLMKKDSVDREIQAVDSEFMMSQVSDTARKQQLLSSCANDGHPMGKFFWGNTLSLKEQPEEKGVDVYGRLDSFYKRIYSSHYMALVVEAKESLDDLEEWVRDIYSKVPHNGKEAESFHHMSAPFDDEKFHKLYKIVPIKDMHQLEINWVIPTMQPYYRVKPLHYIGWLVGHEGKGSLLSLLKARRWGLSLASGCAEQGFEQNQTCSVFQITLTLTDEGFQNSYEVLTCVFQYLDMLRRVGPAKRIYDEIQTIEDNEFRWKEQSSPSDYVQRLAENMQLFPPEQYLTGDELLLEYDPKVIADCQDLLVPEKANIMFLSKEYEKEGICNMKEPWFGTMYTVCDINPEWEKAWKDLPICNELHLPEPNKYIATDFSLKSYTMPDPPEGCTLSPPLKIVDTDTSRLWFKADSKFNVPKAYIYFHLGSAVLNKSPASLATFELFSRLLTHNLAEVAYSADVAQLTYEFSTASDGLEIKLNGFNHKLQKLFETIVEHIAEFKVDEGMFEIIKQQLVRQYYNKMIKVEQVVKEARFAALFKEFHSTAEKRAALAGVTMESVTQFVKEFTSNCYVEGLIHGNYNAEEATEIHNYITTHLSNTMSRADLHKPLVINIPSGETCLQLKSFNPTDPNSAVVCYYQHGPGDLHQAVVNELLETMLEEPSFNYLRTQEQLGYTVYSYNLDTAGIIGLSIGVHVQATKFSTQHVDSKIRDFLDHFLETLDSFTQEQFQDHVSSLTTLKRSEDMYLGEEASRHWGEIRKQRYLFNRLDTEIAELNSLTLDEVRSWFKQMLIADDKKKISLQIVGCETDEADVAVPSSDKTPSDIRDDRFNIIMNESNAAYHINDLQEFKKTNACYPVSKIMPRN